MAAECHYGQGNFFLYFCGRTTFEATFSYNYKPSLFDFNYEHVLLTAPGDIKNGIVLKFFYFKQKDEYCQKDFS
jgi:hypothetical protein